MKNGVKRITGWLLCLALLISALYVPMSISVSAANHNYYVKRGGTGDGRSVGSPACSVAYVTNSMYEDGLTAADTAYVYIIRSDGDTGNTQTLTSTDPINAAAWESVSALDDGVAKNHTCKMVVQSYDTSNYSILAYYDKSNENKDCNLYGPTEFNYLQFLCQRDGTGFVCNGYSLDFGDECLFRKLSGSQVVGAFAPKVVMTKYINNVNTETVQNFSYLSGANYNGQLYIVSDSYDDNKVHYQDANILFNHANVGLNQSFKLFFGGDHSYIRTHTFKKNLNIDIRAAANIGFKAASYQKIKVEGGLQIITNPTTLYHVIDGAYGNTDAYTAITNVPSIMDTDIYVLTVAADDRGKIEFTETAGKYKITDGYTVTATNNDTSETVKTTGGYLNLSAGDWTVNFAKYYVQYGGTGDGRSVGSPARSVKTAIASLNADGLGAGDIVNIYVLSSDGVTSNSHTLTPWGTTGDPEQTHTADIVVQGYGGKQWLAYGSNMNSNLNMSGPTTFTNIKLFSTSENTGSGGQGFLRAYGYNLTFGEGFEGYRLAGSTTYATCPLIVFTRNTNSEEEYDITTEQTFIYKCAGERLGYVFVASENYDRRRHKEDVNAIFDHADIGKESAFRFVFGGSNANSTTHVFEKNFNIDVRNAKNVGFKSSGSGQKVQVNGALQIITNPSTLYHVIGGSVGNTDAYTAIQEITSIESTTKSNIRVLTVNPEDRDKIDFTATAGTYSVADGYFANAVNNRTGEKVNSGDSITLPAGDWTVSFIDIGFKSHSLVLSDSIGVNFFVDLHTLSAGEKAGSYMTFEISNGKSDRAEFDGTFTGNGGTYGFTCDVSSVGMAESITPTLHYGSGETIVGVPYSVKDYIDYVVAHSGSFTSQVVTLVKAIGDYGHYAQAYLGPKNGWTAGTNYTAIEKYRATEYNSTDYSTKASALAADGKAISYTGISNGSSAGKYFQYALNLDYETSILIKFNTGNVTFTSVQKGGVNYENRKNAYTADNCTLYLYYLPVSQLGEAITVSGTVNGGGYTINISALSYVHAVLSSGSTSTAHKNAVSALYDYYKAAETYQTSLSS